MSHPITEKVVAALAKYQWCFCLDTIETIFPREDISHMTEKWLFCNRNLLAFWDSLDSDNKELLLENIQYQHFYLKPKE